jgi:hypothetical protein
MATITELVTSCANASAELAAPSIGLNVVSTANAVATTPVAPSIGYNVESIAHAVATPQPFASVTINVIERAGATGDGNNALEETPTSTADASATAEISAEATEFNVSSADATASPDVQVSALALLVSSARATSEAILSDSPVTIWVNAKTMAAAVWEGPTIDAYAVYKDRLMASGKNLVTFGADTDAGSPINVRIIDDWRHYGGETMHKARFVSAYLSAVAAAPMRVGVETEANGAYQYDTHLPSSTKFVNHRAVFGRGLVGEYARLSFINVDGADFDVAALAVYAFERPRHIGG